jgi:hypothetical protein
MSIFQIISSLFALFMLYVVTIHKSRSKLTQTEVSIWYGLWIFFIILALFPNLLQGVTDILKFERVFDLLIVGAFMVLSAVVFLSYFQQKSNQTKIEEFVRSSSIKEAAQKKTVL